MNILSFIKYNGMEIEKLINKLLKNNIPHDVDPDVLKKHISELQRFKCYSNIYYRASDNLRYIINGFNDDTRSGVGTVISTYGDKDNNTLDTEIYLIYQMSSNDRIYIFFEVDRIKIIINGVNLGEFIYKEIMNQSVEEILLSSDNSLRTLNCDFLNDFYMDRKVIFVDMDYTLSIPKHREHKLPHKIPEYSSLEVSDKLDLWKEYFKGCSEDPRNEDIIKIVNILSNTCDIIILTARDYTAYDETKLWLENNNINYSNILMRDVGDQRPAPVVKMEIINNWKSVNPNSVIDLIIDDDERNIKEFEKNGYKTIHVRKNDD